jgi:hypothetical protein
MARLGIDVRLLLYMQSVEKLPIADELFKAIEAGAGYDSLIQRVLLARRRGGR